MQFLIIPEPDIELVGWSN